MPGHVGSPLFTMTSVLIIAGIAPHHRTVFDPEMEALRNGD